MEVLVGLLSLLVVGVAALVCLVVWRDRRELKISQVEELAAEVRKMKEEMEKMLAAARRHTDLAVSQVEGQVKQVRNSVAHLEQRLHVVGLAGGEKRNPGREKAEARNRTRKNTHREQREARQKEPVKINDGEKYAKLYELAEQGLSTQEIAQQLNLGQDEVELVLELKGKR